MMYRPTIHAACACVAILFIVACVGIGAPKPTVETEAQYKARALALVAGPVPELALYSYDLSAARYPAASDEILQAYADREKTLYDAAKSAGDLKHLEVAYANLRALGKSDASTDQTVHQLIVDAARANKQSATLLGMQYADHAFQSKVELRQMNPLADFQKLTCHVIVHWTRKTVNGIVRTDSPYFTGSGFFVDATHVVTAYHVVEPVFDTSTVSWSVEIEKDGAYREVQKLVAYDSIDDIAVLQTADSFDVPANIIGLFGDSASVSPGFDIYCLGDPQGYESTWTKGIVSAVSRPAPEIGTWMQIDAAVSSGASGGPVVGTDGRIYGMVIAASLYGDINFAVPSRTLLEKLDGLVAGENVSLPWLGLLMEDDSQRTGKLVVSDVFPSSPLAGTRLAAGDTILEINGVKVNTVPEAQAVINDVPLGAIVRVKVSSIQNQDIYDLYVSPARRPEYAMYNATQDFNKMAVLYPYFGFKLDINNPVTANVTIKGRAYAVVTYPVLDVKPKSVLDGFGVKPGDRVGVLSDDTQWMKRTIDLLHLPKGVTRLPDIEDQIITLTKEAYDENIL